MDPTHLNRLKEEQQKAVYETKEQIKQCENFKSDYKALQDRLKTLPDKVTHEIMVPFGKLAFMPGQIVHTNEVMVLLGDNWFAERSARQASEIAGRRMKELDKKIQALNEQMRLLEPRLGFTSNLESELQGKTDVKEIREEYDEEAEQLWDDRHRESVRRYKEQQRCDAASMTAPKSQKSHDQALLDEQLWARLEELEQQEADRREMESDETQEDEDHGESNEKKSRKDVRRVSFADIEYEKKSSEHISPQDSDDDDDDLFDDADTDSEEGEEGSDDGDDEEEGEDSNRRPKQKIIYFSHSKTQTVLPHMVSSSGDGSINSPADIYKLFHPPSILKKSPIQERKNKNPSKEPVASSPVTVDPRLSAPQEPAELCQGQVTADHRASDQDFVSSAKKAFSGYIVERPVQPAIQPETQRQAEEPPRRVSKFRAKRMGHSGPS